MGSRSGNTKTAGPYSDRAGRAGHALFFCPAPSIFMSENVKKRKKFVYFSVKNKRKKVVFYMNVRYTDNRLQFTGRGKLDENVTVQIGLRVYRADRKKTQRSRAYGPSR